jgi:cytochrome P450
VKWKSLRVPFERVASLNLVILRRLPYLLQVIHESLRLYPPAWSLVFREVVAPLPPGERVLPVGAVVYMSTYLLHHDERFWPAPERFDPERFAGAWEKRVATGSYVPFGIGARSCAGRHVALMEVAVTLATVLRRFRLLPVGEVVAPEAAFTLQPSSALRVQVRAQSA